MLSPFRVSQWVCVTSGVASCRQCLPMGPRVPAPVSAPRSSWSPAVAALGWHSRSRSLQTVGDTDPAALRPNPLLVPCAERPLCKHLHRPEVRSPSSGMPGLHRIGREKFLRRRGREHKDSRGLLADQGSTRTSSAKILASALSLDLLPRTASAPCAAKLCGFCFSRSSHGRALTPFAAMFVTIDILEMLRAAAGERSRLRRFRRCFRRQRRQLGSRGRSA